MCGHLSDPASHPPALYSIPEEESFRSGRLRELHRINDVISLRVRRIRNEDVTTELQLELVLLARSKF